MGFWNLFRRTRKQNSSGSEPLQNGSYPPGEFEFLITGDVDIPTERFFFLMTPTSTPVTKQERDGWIYFQVDGDEFSYSWEEPGIQMVFNKEATFAKAKLIADEVVEKLKVAGYEVNLLVLDNSTVYRFD